MMAPMGVERDEPTRAPEFDDEGSAVFVDDET